MKRKYIVIMLFFIALAAFIGTKTYSYYVGTINVSVSSQASNIICDAEILEVQTSEKNIYGYSEFKVRVKNYDSSNNVSSEPFDYTLTIENSDASNGEFSNNGAFSSSLVINNSITSSSKDSDDYIIQVKSSNGLSENVDYKASLSCVQKN